MQIVKVEQTEYCWNGVWWCGHSDIFKEQGGEFKMLSLLWGVATQGTHRRNSSWPALSSAEDMIGDAACKSPSGSAWNVLQESKQRFLQLGFTYKSRLRGIWYSWEKESHKCDISSSVVQGYWVSLQINRSLSVLGKSIEPLVKAWIGWCAEGE